MILIPVKNLASAKQRLAPILPQHVRTELAQTMLQDVVSAVADFAGDEVSLVTSDPVAIEIAAGHGFEIIRDDANLSETHAIAAATGVCEGRGIATTMVIPADIPLIAASEIRAIYDNAPETGSVLVPSHDQRGTNAILRRPAALFPLRFGNDSFVPHLASAKATERACLVLTLAGIGLDVDTPEDLRQLALVPGEKASQKSARRILEAVSPGNISPQTRDRDAITAES